MVSLKAYKYGFQLIVMKAGLEQDAPLTQDAL